MLALTPIRESVEKQASLDLRDAFLCHAWDDRLGPAKELHDLLEAIGVKVWFSEKDVGLGVPLMRAIDKGLAKSRIGIVLVGDYIFDKPNRMSDNQFKELSPCPFCPAHTFTTKPPPSPM